MTDSDPLDTWYWSNYNPHTRIICGLMEILFPSWRVKGYIEEFNKRNVK